MLDCLQQRSRSPRTNNAPCGKVREEEEVALAADRRIPSRIRQRPLAPAVRGSSRRRGGGGRGRGSRLCWPVAAATNVCVHIERHQRRLRLAGEERRRTPLPRDRRALEEVRCRRRPRCHQCSSRRLDLRRGSSEAALPQICFGGRCAGAEPPRRWGWGRGREVAPAWTRRRRSRGHRGR
jgi:hypothetical protein